MDLLLALFAAPPKDEDVVAGYLAAALIVGLIVAAVFLAFSFNKQIRKAQAAKDAGVYGDQPVVPEDDEKS